MFTLTSIGSKVITVIMITCNKRLVKYHQLKHRDRPTFQRTSVVNPEDKDIRGNVYLS